jgi:hypothetical protein
MSMSPVASSFNHQFACFLTLSYRDRSSNSHTSLGNSKNAQPSTAL